MHFNFLPCVVSVVHVYFLLSQVKSCVTAFHVTCGFKHNLEMKTILDDEATDGVRHIVSLKLCLHCVYLTNFVSLWIHCAISTCLCCFGCHKWVSQSCTERPYERDTKSRDLTSLLGMVDSMEEVIVSEKKCRKWHVCCAVLHYISYAKFSQILRVLWDSHRLFGSRNSPTTGTLHTISTMFTSMCGPSEKCLALPLCLNIMRIIVKLAYW